MTAPMLIQKSILVLGLLASLTTATDHAERLIEWTRQNGGFFTSKIAFKLLDENDKDSPFGTFALEDIKKGETLFILPRACLLTSGGSLNMCDSTRNLIKEYRLGEESKFAPYVSYVFDPKHKGQLPAQWSEEGKALIETVVGKEMPPFHVTDISFDQECKSTGDPLEEDAWIIMKRRSWDDLMVPLLDMINHRNGKWFNVDNNSPHDGDDVIAFASRDIKKGEQLYYSYNECIDCIGYAWTYVTPDIFKEYGFVEQYPRRWNIEDLVFEIDQDEDTKELKLKFLEDEPNSFQLKFMRGQLKRLKGLKDYVMTRVEKLESEHERFMTLQYYDAVTSALDMALAAHEASYDEECSVPTNVDEQTCAFREYDPLENLPKRLKFNYDICDFDGTRQSDSYEDVYDTESTYQSMSFNYSPELDDTCLFMNNHLHACASFRPHYHEVFVHYPARFVDEVKRVAFIGGGDNMIVHEILKYPSLELALGLELDQKVVRSSFLNFGTQPHFDDERLQWWFGDASKSILMLPQEYYGSFDVVYVDLQNDVVDFLKVAGTLSITDAAMLLLKPDGVIARNEDWEFASANPFTDYTVDIFYADLPIICYQGITLGSNAIDFLLTTPKDHGVDTIYMKLLNEVEDPYDTWFNYRKSINRTDALCKEPGTDDKSLLTDEMRSRLGLLLVIEAENTTVPLESEESMQELMKKTIKDAGLTETGMIRMSGDYGFEFFFMLKEGYVMVRVWPKVNYCGFEVQLWSNTFKMEEVKAHLVAAVGSKTVSSFRIVTSGMFGVSNDDEDKNRIGPHITKSCDQPEKDESTADKVVDQGTMDTVLNESLSLIHNTSAPVVVVCGEESQPCKTLQALEQNDAMSTVVPVRTCPSLQNASPDVLLACESETLRTLESINDKIGSIVIDSGASRVMGQILRKIFSHSQFRRKLLDENHVVISTTANSADASWHRVLADRFRTHIAKYDPAYRADVRLDGLHLNVFSSGDEHFFLHLKKALDSIQAKTGIAPEIQNVTNGINNYVADFAPSKVFSHADYDDTAPLEQWRSQQVMEAQTVYQFTTSKPLSTSSIQKVLDEALEEQGDEDDTEFGDYEVGDGSVILAYWPLGTVLAVWDGQKNLSVSMYTLEDLEKVEIFLKTKWTLLAKDEFPRGIGRVVNFPQDLEEREEEVPHWAKETDVDETE